MTPDRSTGAWELSLRQHAAIAKLSQLGLRIRDLDEVLREAMVLAAKTLGVADAVLFEVRPELGDLQCRAAILAAERVGRHRLRDIVVGIDNRSLPGYTAKQRNTVVSADIEHDERFHALAGELNFPGRSAIATPVAWDQHLVGVVAVYDRDVRQWSEDDVLFVEAVGTTIGLAMQRSAIERDVAETGARLATSLSAGGLGAWSWEVDTGQLDLSPTALAMLGVDAEGWGGSPAALLAVIHPADRDRLGEEISSVQGEAEERHTLFRILRPTDGEIRWIESWGRELSHDDHGQVRVGVFADVTDRRLADEQRDELLVAERDARRQAEASRERLAFIADASAVMSSSLDAAVTVEQIARLYVPRLAQVCFVDLLDDLGGLVEVAAVGDGPDVLAAAQAVRERRRALGQNTPTQTGHIAALGGQAIVYQAISDEQLRAASADEEHYQLFLRADARSTILAPLVARAQTVGVLALIRTSARPEFDEDDVALVSEVAGRAALAIDNARLYESRARVARSLQAALLPPALPSTRGLAIAARYDVAEADVAIGGDFYDVIELGGGAWGIVVGDVCGRGPDAAALTGLVRHSIRSAVVNETSPSAVLANTNAAVLNQIDDSRFCTAAFLRAEVVDVDAGVVRASVASAGHPRPILVRADGTATPFECSGTLLGVVPQPRLVEAEAVLEAGDSIVLYTDGVTEARRGDELFGEARLLSVLRDLAPHPAEVIATGVEASVAAFRRDARDDTAILVVQAVASP